MKIYRGLSILILVLLFCNGAMGIVVDPSVDFIAENFTLNTQTTQTFDSVNVSSNPQYVELSWDGSNYHNITFVTNVSSSRDLVELFGVCGLGNYTTNVSFDLYAPSDWTVSASMSFITASNLSAKTSSPDGFTQVNSTHRNYYYTYNPRNTLSGGDMGLFDVNISISAFNTTLSYSGYNYTEDLFTVYKLNPISNFSGGYNTTWDSLNFSWSTTNESVFYFDDYDPGTGWTLFPANMADGSLGTAAWAGSDGEIELLNNNTCDGTNVGTISSVKIRYNRVYFLAGPYTRYHVIMTPVFGGSDGDSRTTAAPVNHNQWTEWFDVTNDTNAPGTWTWGDVETLDCRMESDINGSVALAVLKVEIMITHASPLGGGANVDSYVIVRSNISCPDCPSDGYEVQNSTSFTYNVSANFSGGFFSVFTYNNTTKSYSSPFCLPWAVVIVSCFNESNPSQAIGFNLEIVNEDASQVYYAEDLTNYHMISSEDIPFGDDTLFIVSNSSYKPRTYIYDLGYSNYYNFTFYLPPISMPSGSGDEDCVWRSYTDSNSITNSSNNLTVNLTYELVEMIAVYVYNSSTGVWVVVPNDMFSFNSTRVNISSSALDNNSTMGRVDYYYEHCEGDTVVTRLYRLRVIDNYEYPVPDAKIVIKRYINSTDTYETIGVVMTDGYGNGDVYLIPDSYYKAFITKEGYEDSTSNFFADPVFYGADYPKIFQIVYSTPDIVEIDFWDVITFTGTMYTNNSIKVVFQDSNMSVGDLHFLTFENYNFTSTLISSNLSSDDNFTFWVKGINTSRKHTVILFMNHTYLGYRIESIPILPIRTLSLNTTHIEGIFSQILGVFSLGYVRTFFLFIPSIALLVLPGRKHPGFAIVLCAAYLGGVSAFLYNPLVITPVIAGIGIVLMMVKGGHLKL